MKSVDETLVVLTFKSVDKTLECDHSNESYFAVISCSNCFLCLTFTR